MATADERIAQLERAQIDTNHHLTMLLGIVSEQQKDLKAILQTLDQHTIVLTQHSQLLTQHGEILTEHTALLREILDRLPPKE